jgi:hypothetical protein
MDWRMSERLSCLLHERNLTTAWVGVDGVELLPGLANLMRYPYQIISSHFVLTLLCPESECYGMYSLSGDI